GCAAGSAVETPGQPPDAGLTRVVAGASDSVSVIPGSPDALYLYRFRQTDPASDRFTFQDRELSFYFKPTPDALHFQVENRQNRPVWVVWERSRMTDPSGVTGKVAHSTTRWADRFKQEPDTQIPALASYGDYVLPREYLLDPASSSDQLHRPLFPEDNTAPQYADRYFGVDLAMTI